MRIVTRVENKCGRPVTILEIDEEDNYFLLQKIGVEESSQAYSFASHRLPEFLFGIPKLLLNQIRNGVCKIAKPIIHHLLLYP
jgi:hypothetical protein